MERPGDLEGVAADAELITCNLQHLTTNRTPHDVSTPHLLTGDAVTVELTARGPHDARSVTVPGTLCNEWVPTTSARARARVLSPRNLWVALHPYRYSLTVSHTMLVGVPCVDRAEGAGLGISQGKYYARACAR